MTGSSLIIYIDTHTRVCVCLWNHVFSVVFVQIWLPNSIQGLNVMSSNHTPLLMLPFGTTRLSTISWFMPTGRRTRSHCQLTLDCGEGSKMWQNNHIFQQIITIIQLKSFLAKSVTRNITTWLLPCAWASCQIRKITDYACVENAGIVFPATNFRGNRLLVIPTCIATRASCTCRDAFQDR